MSNTKRQHRSETAVGWWPAIPLLGAASGRTPEDSPMAALEQAAVEAAQLKLGKENVEVYKNCLFVHGTRDDMDALFSAFHEALDMAKMLRSIGGLTPKALPPITLN